MAPSKRDIKGVVSDAVQTSENRLCREIRDAKKQQTQALEKKIDAAVDEVGNVIIDTVIVNEELYPRREEFGKLKTRVDRLERYSQSND